MGLTDTKVRTLKGKEASYKVSDGEPAAKVGPCNRLARLVLAMNSRAVDVVETICRSALEVMSLVTVKYTISA